MGKGGANGDRLRSARDEKEPKKGAEKRKGDAGDALK